MHVNITYHQKNDCKETFQNSREMLGLENQVFRQ